MEPTSSTGFKTGKDKPLTVSTASLVKQENMELTLDDLYKTAITQPKISPKYQAKQEDV